MGTIFTESRVRDVYTTALPEIYQRSLLKGSTVVARSLREIDNKIIFPITLDDYAIFLRCLTEYIPAQHKVCINWHLTDIARAEITNFTAKITDIETLKTFGKDYTGLGTFADALPYDSEKTGTILVLGVNKNLASMQKFLRNFTDLTEITTLTEEIMTISCKIYKQEKKRLFIILTDAASEIFNSFWIRLTSLLPRFFPEIFNPELFKNKELQDLFTEYAQTFNTSTESQAHLIEHLTTYILKHFNLKRVMLENTFLNLNKEVKQNLVSSLQHHITDLENKITTYFNELEHSEIEHRDLQYQLTGMMQNDFNLIQPEDIDILARLESIEDVTYSQITSSNGRKNSILTIIWHAPLCMIDEELLNFYMNSTRANIWNSDTVWTKFIKLIFIEKTYILYTKCKTQLNLDAGTVSISSINLPRSDELFWIGHPHINRHACLGTNKSPIEKALKSNNLVYALCQLNAAVQQYNIADGIVTNTLKEQIERNTTKISILCKEDQQYYTLKKAFEKEKKAAEQKIAKQKEKVAPTTEPIRTAEVNTATETVPTPETQAQPRHTHVTVTNGHFNIQELIEDLEVRPDLDLTIENDEL